MAGRFILVRHGETEWNRKGKMQGWRDVGLNQTGRYQAQMAGVGLKDERVDRVFSSDLARAYETVKIISEVHGVDVVRMREFRERNMGELEGLDKVLFRKRYFHIYNRWRNFVMDNKDWEGVGGETDEELFERVKKGVEKLKKYDKETVLVGLHGQSKIAFLMVLGLKKEIKKLKYGFRNTGVTIVEKGRGGYRSIKFGDNSHLLIG